MSRQRVECDGRYAYDWRGDEPLAVGDLVEVGVDSVWHDVFGRTVERRVTSLATNYDGPCQQVLRKLEEVG